ncbi:hypothetical protein, partial [Streptomyces broussonetiae]|uniref:hypothetical protein n=1 Tax=Streptomyces broussonetiae TaxID=2686304 RepID=UPI0035EB35A6
GTNGPWRVSGTAACNGIGGGAPRGRPREEARAMSAPASTKTTNRATSGSGREATGGSTRARVGDEIVVRGTTAGAMARIEGSHVRAR